jgi:DNA-directed RNA polymerase subunit RPC12/RpoP
MASSSFYDDRKYCLECDQYVPYLMSAEHSYCSNCGSRVQLFSKEDWSQFSENLKPRRIKGDSPDKKRDSA